MTSLWTFFWQTSNYFRTLKGNTFLESVFAGVKISGLQGCSVREKGTVSQRLPWNFRSFRIFFPFRVLSECICNAVFGPLVGCRLYSCNYSKTELHYMRFSDIFQSFRRCYLNILWNHLWRGLLEFWDVDYSPVLY